MMSTQAALASSNNISTISSDPSQAMSLTNASLGRHGNMLSSNDAQPYQALDKEIQHMTTTHQDEVMELKIRVAVLENELKHAKKKKEDGLQTLRVVVESLTRNTTSVPSLASPSGLGLPQTQQHQLSCEDHVSQKKQFEAEINRLRRENRYLRERSRSEDIEQIDSSSRSIQEPKPILELPEHHNPQPRSGHEFSAASNGDKGKEKMVDLATSKVESRGLDNIPTGPKFHYKAPEVPTASMLIGSWGQEQSFDEGLPTIPNSPVLTAMKPVMKSFDVGLNSLEDNLSDDGPPQFDPSEKLLDGSGFPAALEAVPSTQKDVKEYPELDKGIDEQLADEEVAILNFKGPAPNVLKTGFQVGGNKRGEDYDPMTRLEAPRTYIRSQCLWRDPGSSSDSYENIRMGPRTAFEIPKDRSFDGNLWDSVEEREVAIRANAQLSRSNFGRGERAFPDLFRYGIQYRPDEGDSNYLRTVHLSNLPSETDLREVLARVRGGDILGATLLNTTKLTGGLTARVVFIMEASAEDYVLYAADHPITFGEDKQVATVTLINTPTFPLNPSRRASIREREHSRCIAIPEFPENISLRGLERTLACGSGYRAESLVEFWIDESATLHLEFSSVDIAGSAYGILTSRRIYGNCPPVFEQDPCAGPVEELEQHVPPRPPMLPRHRQADSVNESFELSKHDESGVSTVRHAENMQRRRLAALDNQKVEIPSFSGAGIKSSSWADEVIDEAEDDDGGNTSPSREESLPTATPPNEAQDKPIDKEDAINEHVNILATESVNKLMADDNTKLSEEQKRPIGLAGSKYASFVPEFEDHGERPRLGGGRSFLESASNVLDASTTKTANPTAQKTGMDLHIAEELARDAEAQSENAFNTFTRQTSSENLAVQTPHLDPHQVFRSTQDTLAVSDYKLSRSPPRVNLQELIASSDSSNSRSSSPAATQLGPFHISFLDVNTPTSSSNDGDKTAKPTTAIRVTQSENENASSERRQYPVHHSPNNPVPRQVEFSDDLQDRKNASFEIPPMEEMHSVLFERRKRLGLSFEGMKRKREQDVDEENLTITTDDLLNGAESTRKLLDGEEKDGFVEGEEEKGAVVNPDEISLDDEE
ncbi:uncharacterized protein LY89DRAFT_307866 [Mollisia scopiformis]|uniref:Uncharacterized protein n=1 Tax=Mollisia scopiformis TaxID=149040 RepID=A0A194XSI5_MOLSC|nr:uncharacterized protein LY89DRAFT_307866 [Mollisia scopiformis]KUJ22692.1 hypothetical protein LY89DRAFT_307866 [Mollisia scopiformis]